MHQVIFVPGLGDNSLKLSAMLELWKKDGIDIHLHLAPWKKFDEPFEEKLERLVKKIDAMSQNNNAISLLGTSAGGSFIINAFAKRKNKIHRLVTVSSRLLEGRNVFPSLELASKGYSAFRESVQKCEKILPTLTASDKKKMLTTQSQFFDEVVPLSTMTIPGVVNIKIPIPTHILSIAATMTLFRKALIDFLKSENYTPRVT